MRNRLLATTVPARRAPSAIWRSHARRFYRAALFCGPTLLLFQAVSARSPGTRVAAGEYHSVYVESVGSLWDMGNNTYGQLGDGTNNTDSSTPERIVSSNVAAIACGYDHTLFLKSDGSLWAVGYNFYGQLGDGTTDNGTYQTNSPEQIVSSNVTVVAGGGYHSLFVKSDGSLWAMGDNTYGELGDGTTNNRASPEQIVSSNVTAIACGVNHSLFVKSDGSLWAMGYNYYGQLGDGTTDNGAYQTNSPEQIVSSNVTAIAAGGGHSLFLKSDGSLWAMGYNLDGELGDGTTTNHYTAEQIVSSNVTAIATGTDHSLFVKSDGSLWDMGYNAEGQLGDGTTNNRASPEQIVSSSVTAIAAGSFHSLFVESYGSLWAMGYNAEGQLGDGTATNELSPEQIGVNTWIDGNGKWETGTNWSTGLAPSLADLADTITNAGNNIVTIDATTATNFPSNMTINNLYVAGTASSTNTLLLNNAGTNTPLQVIGTVLTLDTNGAMAVNNSAVVATNGSVQLYVGNTGGNASLIITNGGAVSSGSGNVGNYSFSSNNAVLVAGPGSVWNNINNLYVGSYGSGNSLTITNGGTVYNGNGYIGLGNGANSNTVLVTGSGSVWNNTNQLYIGNYGAGNSLTIASGGTVYSLSANIGFGGGANSNTVLVTGPGSAWDVGGIITISQYGLGSFLLVTNGGFVQAGEIFIASQPGSSGALTIAGGTNELSLYLQVGLPGSTGTVTVASGALFVTNSTGTASTLVNGSGNTLILGAGTFKTDNLTVTNGGAVEYVQAYQVDNGSVTVAGGTVQADSDYVIAPSANSTGNVSVAGGELDVTGTLGIGNDGTPTNGFGMGSMTVSNGTVLTCSIFLGSSVGGQGQLTVQTNGLVVLDCTNAVLVANDLTVAGGDVEIENGTIYCGESHPGAMTMSNGTANCQMTYVGYDSQGTLSVYGGQMTLSSLLEIGQLSGSTGSVWMSGGQLTATALTTTIGNQGLGQMSVSNGIVTMANVVVGNSGGPGGTLTLAGGALTVNTLSLPNPNSQFIFTGGSLNALGITNSNGQMLTLGNGVTPITVSLLGGISSLSNGLQMAANAALTGYGTINGGILNYGLITAGGGTLTFTGIVTNNGTMQAVGGSVLNFDGPVVNNGVIDALNGSVDFSSSPTGNGIVITSNCVPTITAIQKVGADIHVGFTTCTNAPYAVEYETDLVTGSWTTLTNTTGTGSIMTITDSGAATQPKRFYRVELVVPP